MDEEKRGNWVVVIHFVGGYTFEHIARVEQTLTRFQHSGFPVSCTHVREGDDEPTMKFGVIGATETQLEGLRTDLMRMFDSLDKQAVFTAIPETIFPENEKGE